MTRPRQHCCTGLRPRLRGQEGFTLIELLVTLSIVAILAGVAYPAYRQHVNQASRAELKGLLLEASQFLERNYTLANRYDQDSNGAAVVLPYAQSPRHGTVKYNINVVFPAVNECAGGQCFTLSAAPVGVMAHDVCGTYQLTQTGAQSNLNMAAGMTSELCWQR